jgi:hypothetical protein
MNSTNPPPNEIPIHSGSPPGPQFVAKIRIATLRGETFHSAAIFLAGWPRPLHVIADAPSRQHVQLEILEWSQRNGKTQTLNWQYEKYE